MKARPSFTILTVSACLLASCGSSDLEERQEAVAAAGREVMPFDLDETTHVFEKTPTGGLQTVVADHDDPQQVELIRLHLAEEAERFGAGDFHDPASIHGGDMAGLHDLVMGHDSVSVEYSEVERGAAIRYESQSPRLVRALHQWFDAQLQDHGAHAQSHP